MIKKQGKQKKKLDPFVVRRWAIIATIVLVVVLTAVNVWLAKTVKVERAIAEKQMEKTTEETEEPSTGEAAIGGDFEGIYHTGAPFKFSDTNGKLRLVFFGFTSCPDICPTSLATLSAVQETLGEENAAKVTPIFVTVDPKRDTPKVISSYIGSFHPSMVGVTGTKEQMNAAADGFKVFHSVEEKEADENYMVDHSGYIYLMDEKGRYLNHFPYDVSVERIMTVLKPYIS